MRDPIVRVLRVPGELRASAVAWNELWARCGHALPTSRADLVAVWCEHFAARQPLTAIVVEHEGRMVAALPLVERRRLGVKIAGLPGNDWSPSGDLLLDPDCDVDRACDAVVGALRQCNWSLLDLGAVLPGEARWQAFLAALGRARVAIARREQCRVNVVSIGCDWPQYFAARSRNHRRHIRRALARAGRGGAIELVCHDRLVPDEVEPLLRACFEIEAAGWKGRSQGAVLRVPGAWDFYARQARLLAAGGHLNLLVLKHAGRPIAFEYGWLADGVYYSPKVGYDETYGQFAPGQLLRTLWLERLFGQDHVGTVDFLGTASAATSSWATGNYGVDRVVAALGGPIGRAVVALYRGAWPLADAVRRRRAVSAARPHAANKVGATADGEQLAAQPAASAH